MRSSREYQTSDEDQAELYQKRRRWYQWDTGLNWLFLAFVAIVGYTIIESDVDTYQGERLSYKLVNDGVTLEEQAGDPYMQAGMKRNMHFKGVSATQFFIAKWKWRFAVYLAVMIIPMVVAFARVRSKDRRRYNWIYYSLVAVAILYPAFFWGRWGGFW